MSDSLVTTGGGQQPLTDVTSVVMVVFCKLAIYCVIRVEKHFEYLLCLAYFNTVDHTKRNNV